MDRDMTGNLFRPTEAVIDLGAYRRNLRKVQSMLPENSRLVAVLKSDAYGHGAVPLSRVCEEEGVAMLAVALLEEAIELQNAGASLPLLVLGPLQRDGIREAIERGMIIGVVGPEELDAVAAIAKETRTEPHIQLKLDSGMGRMGLVAVDLPRAIDVLKRSSIRLDAIYTHYANASDPADPFTARQTENFQAMLRTLEEGGITAPLHHTANSAATVRRLVSPGDYARVGLTLFGGEPLDAGVSRLEPLMRWTTQISRLKTLSPGSAVGYGTTFVATRETRVATLPVGYGDGYDRQLSNRGEVLIRGRRAPVIGRVSMDLITVDVTDLPAVELGDEVVLMGRAGDEEISAEEIARLTGTIPYEVFCAVGTRVPRRYVEEGVTRDVRSKFLVNAER